MIYYCLLIYHSSNKGESKQELFQGKTHKGTKGLNHHLGVFSPRSLPLESYDGNRLLLPLSPNRQINSFCSHRQLRTSQFMMTFPGEISQAF